VANDQVIFHLTERHTACLAPDKCLPRAVAPSGFSPLKFDFRKPGPRRNNAAKS
jgi:hypothetical protein